MKIKSKKTIVLQEEVPVYDITVPEHHNFALANGQIVHNSKDVMDAIIGSYWGCRTLKRVGGVVSVEKTVDTDLQRKLKEIKKAVATKNPAAQTIDPQILMNFMKS